MNNGLYLPDDIFVLAFRKASVGMALLSLDDHVLTANEALTGQLGYSAEELQHILYLQEFGISLQESDHFTLPGQRIADSQGKLHSFKVEVTLLRNGQGAPQALLAQFHPDLQPPILPVSEEITETLHDLITNHAQDIISYSSPTGVLQYISPSVEKLLGYKPGELLGKATSSLFHPEDLEQMMKRDWKDIEVFTNRVLHKDGSYLWIESTIKTLRDRSGQVLRTIGISRNVTDRVLTEQGLRASRQELKTILEHSMIIILKAVRTGDSYLCTMAEGRGLKDLGIPAGSLEGRTLDELSSDNRFPMVKSYLDEAWAGNDVVYEGYNFGRIFMVSVCPLQVNGETVELIMSLQDMTERRQLESKLTVTREHLNEAQRITHIGSFEWHIASDTLNCSDEMYRILGMDLSEQRGGAEGLTCFIHPEDLEMTGRVLVQSLASGKLDHKCRIITTQGLEKHVHVLGLLHDEGTSASKLVGTIQDISEWTRMKLTLQETVERYTSLKRYNPDAVLSLDRSGKLLHVNLAAEQLTGFGTRELQGMPFTRLLAGEDAGAVLPHWERIMEGRSASELSLRLGTKQGEIKDILATPAPIVVQRQIVGCYIIAKDVTEQKRRDDQLKNSEKLRLAGELAAAIAHEIRNPLTSIKGFLKLIRNGKVKDGYFQIIFNEFMRIESIMEELLLLAKPQAVKRQRQQVDPLIRQAVALLVSQANLKCVRLIYEPGEEGIYVNCDENQIKQVVINMVKNAIDSMSGGGHITISLKKRDRHARIRIEDEGCGIPQEVLGKLGQPFYTTKESGTGLGLMVCYRIIENHSGRINVSSTVGVGTRFDVYLPIQEAKPARMV